MTQSMQHMAVELESNDGSMIEINGGILTLNALQWDPQIAMGSIEMNGGQSSFMGRQNRRKSQLTITERLIFQKEKS